MSCFTIYLTSYIHNLWVTTQKMLFIILRKVSLRQKITKNIWHILHNQVILMSGSAIMGVQCEQEGAENTAMGCSCVFRRCDCQLNCLGSSCRLWWRYSPRACFAIFGLSCQFIQFNLIQVITPAISLFFLRLKLKYRGVNLSTPCSTSWQHNYTNDVDRTIVLDCITLYK